MTTQTYEATEFATETTEFVTILGEMREHYKSEPTVSFALPLNFVSFDVPAELPPELDEVRQDMQATMQASADEQQSGLLDATAELEADPEGGKSDFITKMNAQREQAKKDAIAAIDKTYDKVIEVGKDKSPEVQHAIVMGMDILHSTVMNIVNTISDFFLNIFENIVEFLQNAVEKIKNFFVDIGKGIASIF
ncbi:hypothetical protein KFU94_60590 [Chloroflexi bacterium TSY]|nr:hypothetical protein [Chloroflexi bacterium TSY]